MKLSQILPTGLLLALAVTTGCGESADGELGGSAGVPATGGRSGGGGPGCTRTPDCAGCADCLGECFCRTADLASCTAACGSGTGGAAGVGGGTAGAGGSPSGGSGGGGGAPDGGAGAAGGGGSPPGGAGGGPPAGTVRLVAVGDTGAGNQAQRDVAHQMDAKCAAVGGCAAVLMLGDNFYEVGVQSVDDPQWGPKFEEVYDLPNLNGLKFYAVLGNHDYGPTVSGSRDAQIQYTSLPVGSGPGKRASDKWTMPDAHYDVPLGDVHLFFIDTQDYSQLQRDDMLDRMQKSKATWKVVVGHHPRYTSGFHQLDNPALGAQGMYLLQEVLFCAGDFLLSGHDHDLELIDRGAHAACPQAFFVISGAGSKLRGGLLRHPLSRFFTDQVEGLLYLEFDGPTLDLEFIDRNGAVLWTTTMTK